MITRRALVGLSPTGARTLPSGQVRIFMLGQKFLVTLARPRFPSFSFRFPRRHISYPGRGTTCSGQDHSVLAALDALEGTIQVNTGAHQGFIGMHYKATFSPSVVACLLAFSAVKHWQVVTCVYNKEICSYIAFCQCHEYISGVDAVDQSLLVARFFTFKQR